MNAEFQAVRNAADQFVRCYDALMATPAPEEETATEVWLDRYHAEMNADFTFRQLKTTIQNTKHYSDEKSSRNL